MYHSCKGSCELQTKVLVSPPSGVLTVAQKKEYVGTIIKRSLPPSLLLANQPYASSNVLTHNQAYKAWPDGFRQIRSWHL